MASLLSHGARRLACHTIRWEPAMPAAIVYTIRPTAPASVPANLGRAAHAAILRLIQDGDPALAARLHDEDGVKPLTVSNVQGLGQGRSRPVDPARDYHLRVTFLSPALEEIAAGWTPERIGMLDLDGLSWQVVGVALDRAAHPWADVTSYEALAAPLLERTAAPPARWELHFAAPVTFRRRGANMPLPLPELVFGSLLDKWNACAPIALPDEVRRYAEECLAISRYDLRSLTEPTSGGAMQVGGVGRCTYVAISRNRYWQACITTLARFAFFSGVGAGAARGFGQARLSDEK
jgi:CRISPR-associated endoribonuclease Cas6